jgi:hypothetical protein
VELPGQRTIQRSYSIISTVGKKLEICSCAAFVGAMLTRADEHNSGSMARSYLKWESVAHAARYCSLS